MPLAITKWLAGLTTCRNYDLTHQRHPWHSVHTLLYSLLKTPSGSPKCLHCTVAPNTQHTNDQQSMISNAKTKSCRCLQPVMKQFLICEHFVNIHIIKVHIIILYLFTLFHVLYIILNLSLNISLWNHIFVVIIVLELARTFIPLRLRGSTSALEQLNINVVTKACKVIDGRSLKLCLTTPSLISSGICPRNKVNSITQTILRILPERKYDI